MVAVATLAGPKQSDKRCWTWHFLGLDQFDGKRDVGTWPTEVRPSAICHRPIALGREPSTPGEASTTPGRVCLGERVASRSKWVSGPPAGSSFESDSAMCAKVRTPGHPFD